MTNKEAIKIVEDFIANLEACDIPIYAEEREALKKLIRTAKNYDIAKFYNISVRTLGLIERNKK